MNRERLIWAIGIFLALAFGLVKCEQAKNGKLSYELEISKLRTQADEKDLRISAQNTAIESNRRQRSDDSLKSLRISTGLKQANFRQAKTIAQLRAKVQPQLDTMSEVEHLVDLQDSSSQNKDAQIFNLESDVARITKSFTAEINSWSEKFKAESEKSDIWETQAIKATKENSKLRSRKFGIGISAGYGIQESGGTVRAGPSIQVGINYNFARF